MAAGCFGGLRSGARCRGAFMAVLDIQITNASLADILGALGATYDEGSWIQTSCLVSEIIVIPLTARLAGVVGMPFILETRVARPVRKPRRRRGDRTGTSHRGVGPVCEAGSLGDGLWRCVSDRRCGGGGDDARRVVVSAGEGSEPGALSFREARGVGWNVCDHALAHTRSGTGADAVGRQKSRAFRACRGAPGPGEIWAIRR